MSYSSAFRSKNKPGPAGLALSWLDRDQHGASVLATARMMLAVEQATREALPPALALTCKVARIDRQQITLAVPAAAYAAKLRQLAPRILQLLADSGWNLTEINVRIQAGLLQTQTKAAPRDFVPLDDVALEAFRELHGNTPAGPLADAISRLLDHHRR